jgi:hypothetical protein
VTLRALLTCQALCAAALLLLASACSEEGDTSTAGGGNTGTQAVLENGYFSYLCVSGADPFCWPYGTFVPDTPRAMPNVVAVGASFNVRFSASSEAAQDGSALVTSVSENLLERDAGGLFVALKPGVAGLLATRGSTIVDVIHVRIEPIASVLIDSTVDSFEPGEASTSSAVIGVGQSLLLRAAAFSQTGQVLAGVPHYQWSSDDSAIAAVDTKLATEHMISVNGIAAGDTTIHVAIDGVSAAIAVKVQGGATGAGGAGGAGGTGGAGGAGGAGGGQ